MRDSVRDTTNDGEVETPVIAIDDAAAAKSPQAKPHRTALRYRGGKWRIAPWIIGHFPPHVAYVEPFMGSCSVLMRKEPSRFEYVNDLDDLVVNFFRMLRDEGDELERQIRLTPFSRSEYGASFEFPEGLSDMERARRLYVLCWQGISGSRRNRSGWRIQRRPARTKTAIRDFTDTSHLAPVVARLREVAIECRPALDILKTYDDPATLFYVDPPYLLETRGGHDGYRKEMSSRESHIELAEALLEVEGMVVLSGIETDLYRELFERGGGWSRFARETIDQKSPSVESLWINPAARRAHAQRRLFGGGEMRDFGLLQIWFRNLFSGGEKRRRRVVVEMTESEWNRLDLIAWRCDLEDPSAVIRHAIACYDEMTEYADGDGEVLVSRTTGINEPVRVQLFEVKKEEESCDAKTGG